MPHRYLWRVCPCQVNFTGDDDIGFMTPYDEAAPKGERLRCGRDCCGAVGLPATVVCLHVHLPATDHPEMASDINRCMSCFIALSARALFKRYCDLDCFHLEKIKDLRAESGLPVGATSSAFPKKTKHLPRGKCFV